MSGAAFDPATTPLLPGVTSLEASAGTGKTFAVSALTVRYLIEAGLSLDQILIVTFTRAATASLRARLRDMLSAAARWARAASGGDLGTDGDAGWMARLPGAAEIDRPAAWARRIESALNGFDQAAVFTIDGFCQGVLTEFALAAGSPLDAELAPRLEGELEAEADDFWRRLLNAPEGRVRADFAAEAGTGPERLAALGRKSLQHAVLTLRPAWDAAALARRTALEARPPASPEARTAAAAEWAALTASEFADGLRRRLAAEREHRRLLTFDDLRQRLGAALDGPSSGLLRERLRARFKVALIDEFQDTDPLQWRIFRRLFGEASATHHLWLVGDPKQAIYGFRGADVFTYLAARNGSDRRLTLGDNWRSEAPLVEAVNAVFQTGANPFLSREIAFEPVRARGKAEAAPFLEAGRRRPALRIHHWAPGAGDAQADRLLTRVAEMTADEAARLLRDGSFGGAGQPGRPLRPRDVAVLVGSHRHAARIEAALARRGIPSVRQTQESVFDSEAAQAMHRILRAVADPSDERAMRSAAATPLLGWSAGELAGIEAHGRRWLELVIRFREYAALWEGRGVLTAWRSLVAREGAAERLLREECGLRHWADAGHLAELLAAAAAERRLGRTTLVEFLERRIAGGAERSQDDALLRLDRDDDAVRIATIHASKGLEYPVVFCPFLHEPGASNPGGDPFVTFHPRDGSGEVVGDLYGQELPDGSENDAWREAGAEQFTERLRLAYVALTRAQHRCHLLWGPVQRARAPGFERSPLAWLLHPPAACPENPADALDALAGALRPDAKAPPPDLLTPLQALADAHPNAVEVVPAEEADGPRERHAPRTGPDVAPAARLEARRLRGPLPRGAVTASYSSLIGEHRTAARPDAAAEPLAISAPAPAAPGPLDRFRGVEGGNCLHAIFERIPQLDDIFRDLGALTSAQLLAHGLDPVELAGPVSAMVERTLRQPLPLAGGPPQALCEIPLQHWRVEAGFHLPIHDLTADRWARAASGVLWAAASPDPWVADLANLGFGRLDGWLTGRIDLIVPWRGRHWIVDWKSNRLGDRAADYERAAMDAEMRAAQYHLQAHLYVLAVHRRLRRRIPDYDYDRHFGGVLYLFVRGVDGSFGPDGAPRGVFTLRPEARVIEGLEREILRPETA